MLNFWKEAYRDKMFLFMRGFLIAGLVLCYTLVYPQQKAIYGTVADSQGLALFGASVSLFNSDSSFSTGTLTDVNGKFSLNPTISSGYLKVSYLGFRDYTMVFPADDYNITLEEDTKVLKEVKVQGNRMMALVKGDTVEYDASQYKTNQYANTEDLISKMPGVTKQNGEVTVQGEKVQRVTVDGKPFFGEDPNMALKNLPAQMVDKVQVHDRKSDQAQLTGVDDGETEKAINIVTKEEYRKAIFGKGFLSYGPPNYYSNFLGLNLFNNEQRISLLYMGNNINVQNFSQSSLASATGGADQEVFRRRRQMREGAFNNNGDIRDFLTSAQDGITETHALGLNFSDFWGKKWDVNMSYFGNRSGNWQNSDINRLYYLGDTSTQSYTQKSTQFTENWMHRFTGRYNWRLNDKTTILFLPNLSLQQSRQDLLNEALTRENGKDTINYSKSSIGSDGEGFSFNNNILFKRQGRKKGSSLVASLETVIEEQYSKGRQEVELLYADTLGGVSPDDFIQERKNYIKHSNWQTEIEWTKSVSERIALQLDVESEYDNNDVERIVNQQNQSETSLSQRPGLSNKFFAESFRNSMGLEFLVNTDKLYYRLSPEIQNIDLSIDRKFPSNKPIQKNYVTFNPSTNMRWKFSDQGNLMLFLGSRTQLPSPEDWQESIDNSNPLLLSSGNPNLDLEYMSYFVSRVKWSNAETGGHLSAYIRAGMIQDKISTNQIIASEDMYLQDSILLRKGSQYVSPVNLDGYRDYHLHLTFGKPVGKLNMNGAVDLGQNTLPSLLNGIKNTAVTSRIGGSLYATSNISEKLDFNIGLGLHANTIDYSFTENLNNSFLNWTSNNTLTWEFWKGWFTRQSVNYTRLVSNDNRFLPEVFLWNMSFGKRFLKDKNLELSIEVFDLLEQNQSISRNLAETYTETVRTNQLQRFYMVKLTYNLQPKSLYSKEKLEEIKKGTVDSEVE